jgi:hypothetical protein
MSPQPPPVPPARCAFAVSPRALAWLKRQLFLLLCQLGSRRTALECTLMSDLSLDPSVKEFFAARKAASARPATEGNPQETPPAPGVG